MFPSVIFINDDYTVNGYSVRTGIVFYTDVKADDVVVSFGKSMPIKDFLRALNELFVGNMGERYGNLAFAMLTGDKSGLADQEMYFNEAGLGHSNGGFRTSRGFLFVARFYIGKGR